MSNERFGNINRIPEATGKSVWGWYTEPEQVTESIDESVAPEMPIEPKDSYAE